MRGHRRVHGQHISCRRHQRDRCKVIQHVVRYPADKKCIRHQRNGVADQRISIGCGTRHFGGAQRVVGARAVFNDDDKRLAERTARSVGGVTDVIDQTTTDTAMWAARQQQIAQALASAGLTGVTVKVIGRDAYLDGEVANKLDRERAVTVTEGAAPVNVRTNLIRVAVGRVFGF